MKIILDIAQFTFKEYRKATGLYLEVMLAVLFLLIYSYMWWTLRSNEVFLALGIFAIVIGFCTTNKLVAREKNPRIYILMTKCITRSQYVFGKILAILIIDSLFLLGLFLIGYFNTQMATELFFIEALLRLIPIFVVLAISISIAMLFSSLILKSSSFFLAIIFLVTGFVQPTTATAILPIQQIIKTSYMQVNPLDLIWYLVAIFDLVLVTILTMYFFKKRELDFELK